MVAKLPAIERKKISDLTPDPANANIGTERGLSMLADSLSSVGMGRSIVTDKHGVIIGGNKTTERAVDQGFEDTIIVHTTGKELVVVQRDDLDLGANIPDNPARRLAYYDNRVAEVDLAWNAEQLLADVNAGVDLSHLFSENELDALLADVRGDEVMTSSPLPDLTRYDVPDAIFANDNDYEIPLLDANLQARSFDLPFAIYGALSRQTKLRGGTYAFYTSDDRFQALWTDPSDIVNSGVANIVEPNFSCYATMPTAIGIYQVYRKRWIARWAQTHGVRVLVDLNVAPKWREINLMGVPKGWKAYCTRASMNFYQELDEEFALACDRAETTTPLFVVYGGGKASKQRCKERGWLWIADQETTKRPIVKEFEHGE